MHAFIKDPHNLRNIGQNKHSMRHCAAWLKMYCKATVVRIARYWHRSSFPEAGDKAKTLDIKSTDLDEMAKSIQWKFYKLCNIWSLGHWLSTRRRMKLDSCFWPLTKNSSKCSGGPDWGFSIIRINHRESISGPRMDKDFPDQTPKAQQINKSKSSATEPAINLIRYFSKKGIQLTGGYIKTVPLLLYTQGAWCYLPMTHLHPPVHCNGVHNNWEIETTCVPTKQQVDKGNVVHKHSRILFSHKEKKRMRQSCHLQ